MLTLGDKVSARIWKMLDDDEIRTGNAMVLDPYGRVLAETCRAGDDVVVADASGVAR